MSAGTILMVEPNPGILIVARNVLSRSGYTVLAVADPGPAISLAESRRIDVVLLDARQASRSLMASLNVGRRVPIILTFQRGKAVDGQPDIDETQPGIASADFLEKPFAPERLLMTVERVLDRWGDRAVLTRADTLVSVRTFGSDELGEPEVFPDTEQTDIFPFAHLLEYDRSSPPVRSQSTARDARAGTLSQHLRTFLDAEGIPLRSGILSACMKACDAVLGAVHEVRTIPGESAASIEGVIPQLSIDQVLQLAMVVGQPSACRIAQQGASVELYYDQGQIAFARHTGLPDGFLLGQLLVASGSIDDEGVRSALASPRRGMWLGQRLRSRGDITDEELAAALRTQTEELVYEVVRWSTGRFAIYADEPLPTEARLANQRLAVPHLLLEGMRRLDEWRRMQPKVGGLESVLGRQEVPKAKLAGLSREDREILQHVDGHRTVAELIQRAARPTFQVYRSLRSLVDRRLVTVAQR